MEKAQIKKVAKIGGSGLISAAAIAAVFIAHMEGNVHKAYRDAGGIWTICRGHTKGVYEGMKADDAQCDKWFNEDVIEAESVYDRGVHVDLPNNTGAAAISFIFNGGSGHFNTSTFRKKLNKHDIIGACNELPKWKMVGARDCSKEKGLKDGCYGVYDRRLREQHLCLDPTVYSSYAWDASGAFVGVK